MEWQALRGDKDDEDEEEEEEQPVPEPPLTVAILVGGLASPYARRESFQAAVGLAQVPARLGLTFSCLL